MECQDSDDRGARGPTNGCHFSAPLEGHAHVDRWAMNGLIAVTVVGEIFGTGIRMTYPMEGWRLTENDHRNRDGEGMHTLAISIQVPPVGEVEKSGDGSNPTQEQMDEEKAARDSVLQGLVPFLQSLPNRPPTRAGNVTGFDLLGSNTWSTLNSYLLLLNVDIGHGGVAEEISKVLPEGSQVSVLGEFASLENSQRQQT